jgi:antibiotic biosynthesis monooxygenase (ABM) superfamily enzyme
MSSQSPDAPGASLVVRDSRASSIIVHPVPPETADRFIEWQRGLPRLRRASLATNRLTFTRRWRGERQEWVAVMQFETGEEMQRWLDSPERAEWIGKLPKEIANFRLKKLPRAFGPWFAGLAGDAPHELPPGWKMAVSVLIALYPTVMLLALLVDPHVSFLGLPASMLISNILSCGLLQWVVMPALHPLLAPWLAARGKTGLSLTIGGAVLIAVVLAVLVLLFTRITG